MKKIENQDDVLEYLKEHDEVRFVDFSFSDILGDFKGFSIPASEVENALEEGRPFDGSSIEGLARIEESDKKVKADPSTFVVFPWEYQNRNGKYKVANMMCDILNPDGSPHDGDARYVLKKTLDRAKKMGFDDFKVGPEPEFFLFKSPHPENKVPEILDKGNYFSKGIGDSHGYSLRKEIMDALSEMNITCEYDHHEVAPSQQEIDLKYDNALRMADNLMIFKFVVKEMARKSGVYATFMPKPLNGENGSGMHVHQSLWKNGENVFYDRNDEYSLSEIARNYMAGELKSVKECTSVLNPTVNSYKRLVPGYEAPTYIVWGRINRSALVRIPHSPKKEATRAELRSPDTSGNPYLQFAVMLNMGLEGIEGKYELSPPCEKNVYENRENFDSLPGSLREALELTEKGSVVRKTFGNMLYEKFMENQNREVENFEKEYLRKVTPYEIEHNLPRL